MAVDRLAARRAAQQETGYDSYPTPSSLLTGQTRNGGYQAYQPPSNPYAQRDDQHEMSDLRTSATSGGGGTEAFYKEIDYLQKGINSFNANVSQIRNLHSQSLSYTHVDDNAQQNSAQLDSLVQATSELGSTLKRRMENLDAQFGALKQPQAKLVKSKFLDAIQEYQRVEQEYRQKKKQRFQRQIKIVNPHATDDDIEAMMKAPEGQVFSQALLGRLDQTTATYRDVQARHEDVKRIEKTITELAQLFNDMSLLVNRQQETVEAIETEAAAVERDVETGLTHTNIAVKSARAARKKRWICFFIVVLIVVILAAGIGGYFATQKKK